MKIKNKSYIIGTLLFLISIVIGIWIAKIQSREEGFADTNTTIFTCTTFLDFKAGDRWERFCNAIDSILKYNSKESVARITKWLVINEYAPERTIDWCKKVNEKYPWIECIQKNETEKGQAASMNMVLERIHPYRFWIHWEEAWSARAPFLEDAFRTMESTDITQLQFTFHNGKVNWMDVGDQRIQCSGRICRIKPAEDTDKFLGQSPYNFVPETYEKWPLYSLLPSINRVSDYLDLGNFSEDPALWPIKFEWDYARRWIRHGNTKAVMRDGPVWRPGKHRSTYE